MPRLPRRITDYGPAALLLDWEARLDPEINHSVHAYAKAVSAHPAVLECVPAYASLLVRFARPKITAYRLREYVYELEVTEDVEGTVVHHDLPVCYHPSLAPDLKRVVATLKTTARTLVKRHTGQTYRVYQVGFRPGFGFLGMTDERIAIDRHASPRRRVPAGAVGLAGRQTGVYPTPSPGGWQLIGRCPVPLLREGSGFSRLHPGDTVRFHPVDLASFEAFDPKTTPWPER